jgi:acyl-CoA synthetase (NDP forming)
VTPDQLRAAVTVLLRDESVDAVISVYTPVSEGSEQEIASALVAARDDVPGVPLLASFPGLAAPPAALTRAGNAVVPFFTYPEHAAKVLAKVVDFAQWRSSTGDREVPDVRPRRTARLDAVLAEDPGPSRWLAPDQVDDVLSALKVPMVPGLTVTDAARAVAAAEVVGYPVVMKVCGPEIVHKTDVGGVVTGLRDAADVRRAWADLSERLGTAMTGALVQRQLRTGDGLELLVGGYRDPAVGPLVMVGLGGTLTDVLADRVLRLPPADRSEALAQVEGLRCAAALKGFRGRGPLDTNALADVMVAVGELFRAYPEVQELDVNPLLVLPDGAWALDARIAVAPPAGDLSSPFRALRPTLSRRQS